MSCQSRDPKVCASAACETLKMPFSDHMKHLKQCSLPSQLSAVNPGQLLATKPLFWKAWHSPDGKNTRREQRSLLLLMVLSFWIHPGHGLFPSWCWALLWVQMVTEVTLRGLGSPLSPPGSQFYPYLSTMDTLPWCQLRMELEQPALPQLLPRAGLPWGEVLALSLDILRVYL